MFDGPEAEWRDMIGIRNAVIVGWLAAMPLVAGVACQAKSSPSVGVTASPACTPWRMPASTKEIHVELLGGHWQFDGGATLIGCRETLTTLTPWEKEAAVRGVATFVQDQSLNAVLKARDAAVRAAATAAVNRAVGRTVVTDIESHFSFGETDL